MCESRQILISFKAPTLCETRLLTAAAAKSKHWKHANVACKMCLTVWKKTPIIVVVVIIFIITIIGGGGGFSTRALQQDLSTGEGKYATYEYFSQ